MPEAVASRSGNPPFDHRRAIPKGSHWAEVASEFSERLRAFADEFPAVADDLLEAIDRYLDSDPGVGDFSLHKHDEIEARINRLMYVHEQLVAAREARGCHSP